MLTDKREITATEKLLNLIRNPEEEKPRLATLAPRKEERSEGPFRIVKVPSSKGVTVGVDVGHEYLRLVKTSKTGAISSLLALKKVPIPSSLARDSDEFTDFLKAEISSFVNREGRVNLWSIMSAANVTVHHLRIPKVPKKEIDNVVFWHVKKESPFDERETILDFEILGDVIDQGIPKIAIIYYLTPKREVEETRRLFSQTGFALSGLSITPFAIQNIFRSHYLSDYEGTVAHLFIGNDFSRIDIYAQGTLTMTRGIKTGINSMVESLMEGLSERIPLDRQRAREILASLNPDSFPAEELGIDLTADEVWALVLPAVERLVRQMERTFEHYTVTLGNERIDKVYLSAAVNLYGPMVQYVGEQLGMESEIFDPLHREKDREELLSSLSERIAFAPAFGIALSDNAYTPNLLYTYRDKAKDAKIKQLNGAIFTIFVALIALLGGIFLYQNHAIAQKEQNLLKLKKELDYYNPPVTREVLLKEMMAVKGGFNEIKEYYRRYQVMAILGELSALSSPEVRLLSLKTKLGPPFSETEVKENPPNKEAKTQVKGEKKEEVREVELEGLVFGKPKELTTTLAAYVVKLDSSPFFREVIVKSTTEETVRKKIFLRFVISMKLEGP